MSDEFREKLRSIQFAGRVPKPKPVVDKTAGTRTTVVQAEDEQGRHAGRHVEHRDGHVDAVITPTVANASTSLRAHRKDPQ